MNLNIFYRSSKLLMSCMLIYTGLFATTPPLVFREQTAEEAFQTVLYFGAKADTMAKNGFTLTLPAHPSLQDFYQTQSISPEEQDRLRPIFYTEIFPTLVSPYSQETIRSLFEKPIEQVVQKLQVLNKNWGFYVPDQYEFCLSAPFGVSGGPYHTTNGYTAYALYQEPNLSDIEILVSIIIMMGLEEPIVKKYNLTFAEKRQLTVLIEKLYLPEIFALLPNTNEDITEKEGVKIDNFITQYDIEHNLPAAIEIYLTHYPR